MRQPRVLWVGDAACSTGFARCTHAACDELWRAGWDVSVLGINYFGDPHEFSYPIYACRNPADDGYDIFGVTRLPVLMSRLKPDVVVILTDPWNVKGYLDYIKEFTKELREKRKLSELADRLEQTPIIGWLAVDGENQEGRSLNDLDGVAVWTEFAARELKRGGYEGEPAVVPLGVDTDIFYPMEKGQARTLSVPAGIPDDAFIVGVVGRNQPRKRLDLTIRYFSDWVNQDGIDDAYLYLHIAPTGESGFDVFRLANYYELPKNRMIVAEPHKANGQTNEYMRALYSAMDVYFTTTQGEGWGLPALEAMACGTTVEAPDWSGLGDWARGAAALIGCEETAVTAPVNGKRYTIGGIPDRLSAIRWLRDLYRDPGVREDLGRRGLQRAAELPWSAAGVGMREVLESVLERQQEAVA